MSSFNVSDSEEINKLLCARRMKHVNRLAGTPTINRQSLAEHCYYTGLLFLYCAQAESVPVTPNEVAFVFMHDIAEVVTGDLLYPAKHAGDNNDRWDAVEEAALAEHAPFLLPYTDNALTGAALKLFRACDMLELFMCVCEERALGNHSRELKTVWNNAIAFFERIDVPSVARLAKEIAEEK